LKYTPRDKSQDPPRGSARLIDPGDYHAVVKRAEEKISKKGNPQIELIITVYPNDGEGPVDVYDYLSSTEAAQWKVRSFCASSGLDYDSGELLAEHCRGQNIQVRTSVSRQHGYPDKNKIDDYLPLDAPLDTTKNPADDDIY
jgi:hypothetical protein